MRLNFFYNSGDFTKAQLISEHKIAHAATGAVNEAAELGKKAARASIAAGGFSTRWQNALRSKAYPQQGESLSPAAFIWHKITYAEVFEEGKTITGHPMLCVRLSTTPKGLTPALAAGPFGKLISLERHGKPPLLAAMMRQGTPGPWGAKPLTARKIRTGGLKRGGQLVAVPLFVGVPSVIEPKKFGIVDAVKGVSDHIVDLYLKHFEE